MQPPIRSAFEPLLLLVGDLAFFVGALWATLLVRYLAVPSQALFVEHVVPFSLLFAFSVVVYFIAGLYDKQLVIVQQLLPQTIFKAQIATVIGGALFFFTIPYFGITPKTILFIYLVLSWGLITAWRLVLFPLLVQRRNAPAVVIGEGTEVSELIAELNSNDRSRMHVVASCSLGSLVDTSGQEKLLAIMREQRIEVCIIDTEDDRFKLLLPFFYNLLFLDMPVRCVNLWQMYEQLFDRIPASALRHGWFMEVFTLRNSWLYLILKRILDIIGALVFGIMLLILLPFVYIAMRLEDDGPIFIAQQRIGQRNMPMRAYKFRTMTHDDAASSAWVGENENRVTRVGAVLRRFSIDEFPQVWNILKGELSFIGPRNDIAGLGARLAEAIPYYNTRYIIKPGISGWAQINQHYAPGNMSPQSLEETEVRLAYDLYYLKHRSFMLDVVIGLKTLRRIFFR